MFSKDREQKKIPVSLPTFQTLRETFRGIKEQRRKLATRKRESSVQDGWHATDFQRTEEEMELIEARVGSLLPPEARSNLDEHLEVYKPTSREESELGSEVELEWKQGRETTHERFTLVSRIDSIVNPHNDPTWISSESKAGRAITGKKVGQIAQFETPTGEKVELRIKSINPSKKLDC